jgi:hypothetical protein
MIINSIKIFNYGGEIKLWLNEQKIYREIVSN